MRDIDKIQRQVYYPQAQIFDSEDTSGKNNTWIYNRAPAGYKFLLVEIIVHSIRENNQFQGAVSLFDGHEYTHWNIFPGVQSNELLFRAECDTDGSLNVGGNLHNWECKEFTIGVRSASTSNSFKAVCIMWYYLQKMNQLETLYYAVIQPRWKRFKKAFATTLSRFED